MANDRCQPAVIAALEKDGWDIVDENYPVELDTGGYVLADLLIERQLNQLYVVEIKCFNDENRWLNELYTALGQYLFYRAALARRVILLPVYLAIPLETYNGFFQQAVVQDLLLELQVKLIVVDLITEVITLWRH